MSSSTDDAPDWTFEIGTLHLEKDSALCEKSLANFDLAGSNGAGIEFGGPLESPKTDTWAVCQGNSQESEKKPFVRQSAVDLGNSDPFGMHYKWRNASKTATRIRSSSSHGDGIVKHYYCKENSLVPLQSMPNTMYRGVDTSRMNVSPKPENYSFSNTSRSVSKLNSSSKPLFSRSATLEWTSKGPSTQTPTSEWIDSFTKQHGLMKTATDQCKDVAETSRSVLGITGTLSKYGILSKSPSAPGDNSTSKMTYANCSTNSSFEQDPTDSITDARTRALAHHGTLSPEWENKYYEKQSGWSRKLKMSRSQFLNVNWTTCNKRSPTFPLISPTSTRKSDRKPVSFEMTCDPVISSTSSDILRASTSFESSRDNSASYWNPVRRRIPAIELHHSPNRSHEHVAATSKRRPGTSSSSGWLSAARKQQARIKKCRAFGKLYTTVRVEDDDVSVLVTTD